MCALVCCALSFDFLKKKLVEEKNALMWLLDRLEVTAVTVLIIQLLFVQIAGKICFFTKYSVANIVSSDYTWFDFCQPKIYMTLN